MARSGVSERHRSCGRVRDTYLSGCSKRSAQRWDDADTRPCFWGVTEMVLNYNLTLSNDTIALYVSMFARAMPSQTNRLRVWISSADAAAVADKGFRFIHAAANPFYLVCFIRSLRCFLSQPNEPALHAVNRIAEPVAGWVTSLRESAGASPSRHGRA